MSMENEPTGYSQNGHPPIEPISSESLTFYVGYRNPYEPMGPYYQSFPPIPPPPPKPKGGMSWFGVLTLCVVCFLLGGSVVYVGVAGVPWKQSALQPTISSHLAAPSPTAQPMPTPTQNLLFPTPTYASGLSSTNPNLFVNAFADALAEQDIPRIEDNTDVKNFLLDCSPSIIMPPGGSCTSSWKTVHAYLSADKLELSIPPDATLNTGPLPSDCSSARSGNFSVLGNVDNKGFVLPVTHFSQAVFVFVCATCGSETTWSWQAVYLC